MACLKPESAGATSHLRRWRTAMSGRPDPSISLVGTALEGLGEAPERGVKHRAHQHRKHAALEFVRDEELDIAKVIADRVEIPAVLHAAERDVQIFDHDVEVRPVERDTAGEGL